MVNYSPNRGKGQACPKGCTCGRHTPVHKPGCRCAKCIPRPKRRWRPPKRSDRCVCGHIEKRHDPFGCKVCEDRYGTGQIVKPCTEFRAATAPKQPRDNTFAREVHREGFITHVGELATCTSCWQPCKIGFVHSVSCVINARAHAQKCRTRLQSDSRRSRPNRAKWG